MIGIVAIVFLLAAFFFLLSLGFKLLKAPIKWALKLLAHAAMGYVFLFLFNFVGAWAGLSLGLNLFNCLVTGVLGVPGVVLLLLLKYLF